MIQVTLVSSNGDHVHFHQDGQLALLIKVNEFLHRHPELVWRVETKSGEDDDEGIFNGGVVRLYTYLPQSGAPDYLSLLTSTLQNKILLKLATLKDHAVVTVSACVVPQNDLMQGITQLLVTIMPSNVLISATVLKLAQLALMEIPQPNK